MGPIHAGSQQEEFDQSRQIDVVLALDVSGAMSGLIDSAKQRLWDIVNELGRAQPQPELRTHPSARTRRPMSLEAPALRCRPE